MALFNILKRRCQGSHNLIANRKVAVLKNYFAASNIINCKVINCTIYGRILDSVHW